MAKKQVRIGKYNVDLYALELKSGGYLGGATFTWDEGNATLQKQFQFDAPQESADDAVEHALSQAGLRVRDDLVE